MKFKRPAVTVNVPPDLSRPPGAKILRKVKGKLKIPASCAAQEDTPGIPTWDGYFAADFGVAGQRVQGTFSSFFWIGKPFTRNNIRYNLGLKTRKPPKTSQAHHTLPQKFRSKFESLNLDIDDPGQMRWWCSKKGVNTNHQSQARSYNARWSEWFATHPKATRKQVLTFRDSIQGLYIYACPGVSNYPGFP
ncbi:hypothetical protein GCM10027456_83310 [Kineosporia babensis]